MPYPKHLVWLLFLCVALSGTSGRGAEARTPALLWDRFVHALETGDMQAAYACFSPLSRQGYSFRQFCIDHHPMTVAYEAILVTPTRSEFQISGDLAELRFIAPIEQGGSEGGGDPGTRGLLVTAMMVQEDGGWHLVPPARQAFARQEAEARNLLRYLVRHVPAVRDALRSHTPLDTDAIRMQAGAMLSDVGAGSILRDYELRTIRQGSQTLLQAWPSHVGLRAFSVDVEGEIHRPGQLRPGMIVVEEPRPATPTATRIHPAPLPSPDAGTVVPPAVAEIRHDPSLDQPSHAPSSGRVRFHDLPPPSEDRHQSMPDPMAQAVILADIVPPLDDAPSREPSASPAYSASSVVPPMPPVPPLPPGPANRREPPRSASEPPSPSPEAASIRNPASIPEIPGLKDVPIHIELPELDIDLPMLGHVPPPPPSRPNRAPTAQVHPMGTSVLLPPAESPKRSETSDGNVVPEGNPTIGNLRPRPEDFPESDWMRPVAVIGYPEVVDAAYPGNLPVDTAATRGTVSTMMGPSGDSAALPRNEVTPVPPLSDPWILVDDNTTFDIPGLLMPEDLP